jgi:uncharacterized RDD family membrane protein YckC
VAFDAMASEPPAEAMSSAAYASWGQRFAAWVLDGAIVLGSIWGPATAAAFAIQDAVTGILLVLVLAFLSPLYYALLHAGKRGQTLGKRALGIAVRNQKTRGRISLGRSLARTYLVAIFFVVWAIPSASWWWTIISIIPFIFDDLWPLWDAKHQTWHDKVAGSVVVRV